ncbi:hypothetical protein K3172_06320 [Qipengyuania sp. 6B39]|uniref:hypothetical protein n=1 Tax=Qipengyuania proteolytica TaxID=2867239 RepID=UPI001C8A0382|nr:hypothetical protein [Qipengyuania proteolytica]MBX7495470.1 hypothetical protein [Qipengyuania proteolytica]
MSETIEQLAEGFWRITGEVRIGGVVDIGTQCSLVRLASGNFVFLDSYTLPATVRQQVDPLTEGGEKIEAILNLHPFHTLHCEWMHSAYPDAALYGTARHIAKFPDLPWQDTRCEEVALHESYNEDFAFSVPRGVPLVCDDESVHFSSVLALHRASGTLHVDDTLVYLEKGFPLSMLPMTGRLDFHPTLAKALQQRADAADDFRQWAIDLGIDWAGTKRIAAAHNAVLELDEEAFPLLIGEALGRVKPVLDKHRAEFG